MLFSEHCFERENLLSSASSLVISAKKLGELALAHKLLAERNSLSSPSELLGQNMHFYLSCKSRGRTEGSYHVDACQHCFTYVVLKVKHSLSVEIQVCAFLAKPSSEFQQSLLSKYGCGVKRESGGGVEWMGAWKNIFEGPKFSRA